MCKATAIFCVTQTNHKGKAARQNIMRHKKNENGSWCGQRHGQFHKHLKNKLE
jgi:hypothetical protein